MTRIAIVEHIGHPCYECGGELAHRITDWLEVSPLEFKALERYVVSRNLILVVYPTEKATTLTIQAALVEAQEEAAKKAARAKATAERKAARDDKKRVKQENEERAELARLQKKFGAQS